MSFPTKRKKELVLVSLILVIAAILRFYNLMYDSPYFFNPDERNMASAITRFHLPTNLSKTPICILKEFQISKLLNIRNLPVPSKTEGKLEIRDCNLNPHFFAYGQFPLYLAFASDQITKPFTNTFARNRQQPIIGNYLATDFPAAIFWLRFWSAVSSVLTVLLVYLITNSLLTRKPKSRRSTNYGVRISHLVALSAAFIPGLIQTAHFGTTESLLTFFFMTSIYLSFKLFEKPHAYLSAKPAIDRSNIKYIMFLSLATGLSLGAKLTGIFIFTPPIIAIFINLVKSIKTRKQNRVFVVLLHCYIVILLILVSLAVFTISSPYNLIEPQNFQSAVFGYEKDVATGKFDAFYTRQFVNTTPILFQAKKIFPFALGWPIFILGTAGFLLTNWNLLLSTLLSIAKENQKSKIKKRWKVFAQRNKIFVDCIRNRVPRLWFVEKLLIAVNDSLTIPLRNLDILRARKFCSRVKTINKQGLSIIISFSFLTYLVPNSFLFTKWTRFMTPIFPFFAIFAGYLLSSLGRSDLLRGRTLKFLIALLLIISILPGIAFMSIYAKEDSRVQASRWIYKNIATNSYILSETANVVDIPVGLKNTNKHYKVISFDFYHLDENPLLFEQLLVHLEKSNYLLVPSRRIFYNYPRLANKYPLITKYYQLLFSGRLGFEKVAEVSSYPSIIIPLPSTHYSQVTFPDEQAEETWTVFDHPVVRIYKKIHFYSQIEYENMFKKNINP